MAKSNKININPSLNPKQKLALRILTDPNSQVKQLLFGGAAGGGKSVVGCVWLIYQCITYPGTRHLIGRSQLSVLKDTTLNTFLETCQRFGLAQGEEFTYNQQSNIIKFWNGSEILLKDLFARPSDQSFERLSGLELTSVFVDECNQISEKAKDILFSRIRFKLDENNLIPRIFLTCNPAKNWVFEFYKKKRDGQIEEWRDFIQALPTDNKEFISKHYLESFELMDEISRKRLRDGDWEYDSDSSALFKYDQMLAMFEDVYDLADNQEPYYLSVDVARLGKDKTCIIVWKGLAIVEIIELARATLDISKSRIDQLKEKYAITNDRIAIDTDGVGGGLADFLKGSVQIVNGSKPKRSENYQNLKTQLFFKLSDLINSGQINILVSDTSIKNRLFQELQNIKREKIDQDGKIRMTTKDQIKAAIGRSPDLADAMAFKMIWHLRSTGYTVMGANSYVDGQPKTLSGQPKRLKYPEFRNDNNNEEDNEFIFFK